MIITLCKVTAIRGNGKGKEEKLYPNLPNVGFSYYFCNPIGSPYPAVIAHIINKERKLFRIRKKMRSRTANWFETRVRYEKTMEDGQNKKVIETYVVDAYTFGEAEEAISKEISAYISGDFEVKAINPATYGEVFFSDVNNDDKWYKCKLSFITIDEKSEREKRTSVYYLVQAASVSGAVKNVDEIMGSTMIDYEIASIADTKIMDVFEHDNKAKKAAEPDDKPEYEQQQAE